MLGTTHRVGKPERDEWWFTEDVREHITRKKTAFKRWKQSSNPDDHGAYLTARKNAKKAVAIARNDATTALYAALDQTDGLQLLYRLAKARDKKCQDIGTVRYIKDDNGVILTDPSKIRDRWKTYFEKLSNEEFPREEIPSIPPVEGPVQEFCEGEVRCALRRMKNGKALGPDGIPAEAWKATGQRGLQWLTSLLNAIATNSGIPNAWRRSVLVPLYKNKGDVQACTNYRGIKLLAHTFKIWERVINDRIRNIVPIHPAQFGFREGNGTTDAIHAIRQLSTKYLEKKKKLHMVFIDLEKAFDRVPRPLLWWSLRMRMVPEQYVALVQDTYQHHETTVRTPFGETLPFEVNVGVHQGSALSPLLFVTTVDAATSNLGYEAPWCMLYADDVVLIRDSQEQVGQDLSAWTSALERVGLKVSRMKTEYLPIGIDSDQNQLTVDEWLLDPKDNFRYLGSIISGNGTIAEEISARIRAAWLAWRKVSGVIYDRRIPLKLKGQIYKTAVRPALLYGAETWNPTQRDSQRIHVTEMRMVRWCQGKTLLDKVPNDTLRANVSVTDVRAKMRQARLRWFGHIRRRSPDYVANVVDRLEVSGRRPRGRPRMSWRQVLDKDMEAVGVTAEQTADRSFWRSKTKAPDPA
jgi:hypothetical protein